MRAFFQFLLIPLTSLLLTAGGARAAAPAAAPLPDDQLYSFIGKDGVPAGAIPWQLLRQVKLVEEKKDGKASMRPEFTAKLKDMDQKQVRVYGFVMPLSTTPKQKHFLLSPLPTHCPFCVAQGPDSIVEVVAKTAVEFSQWDPIVVAGKLELVNDSSLYYRLVDAEVVKN